MRALMTLLCASWWTGFAIAGPQSVDRLLDTLTLQERIRLIHGELESPSRYQGQAGYLAGAPRLGIPALRFGDGPPGVLTRHRATALTSTLGLAATFSPKDAYLNGQIIGRDARALGVNVTLQPFINLMRDPTWARAYDLYGEDPLLVGMMGAGLIRGIQSQGVMAQAKHFIAYNGAMDVRVGEQALHEIYAEPFAYAVQAGVASIMCSYNKINGTYACGNPVTLQTLLRQELGFAGFVTSDWGAAHAATFVNAGLDLEMPGSMLPYLPCYFCSQPSPSQPLPPGGLPFPSRRIRFRRSLTFASRWAVSGAWNPPVGCWRRSRTGGSLRRASRRRRGEFWTRWSGSDGYRRPNAPASRPCRFPRTSLRLSERRRTAPCCSRIRTTSYR